MIYDVIIVGGGLAGLTASIALAQESIAVLVIEKNRYPNHKVCGEYVSNEVRPLLEHLGLDVSKLGAVSINKFSISNQKGKILHTKLPLGGFGISRYTLDEALYQLAVKSGVHFQFDTVTKAQFEKSNFQVKTKKRIYKSTAVIGAQGKRSILDKSMQRPFIAGKSPWLGVKGHYRLKDFPGDQVMLHCFPGGYAGLSLTEKGEVNFCYLTTYNSFQKEKNIKSFNENVVAKNPYLESFLREATPVFTEPLSIGQISFAKKSPVEDHVLMCGDSSGLIHPLCGNGMAMAIHAGKIASDGLIRFLKTKEYSRSQMERAYEREWKLNFSSRLYFGRKVQSAITNSAVIDQVFSLIPNSEFFLQSIIKRTHGKPILV